MTKPKQYIYQIYYNDKTSHLVDWTKAEFQQVCEDLKNDFHITVLDEGVFRLTDVRAIRYIGEPDQPEESEDNKEPEGQMTEWGFVDSETAKWLKDNGIDISKGVN